MISPGNFLNNHGGKMLRFATVGLSNTLVSYVVFRLLLLALDYAFVAQAIGYSAGVLWSYYWNSRWSFRTGDYSSRPFFRFIVSQLLLLVLSTILIAALVDWAGYQPDLSWVAVTALITLLNYAASAFRVFQVEYDKP